MNEPRDMLKMSPGTEKILLAIVAILVIGDIFFWNWLVSSVLATTLAAIASVAVGVIIYAKRGNFFASVAVPAVLWLLKKKTGLDLITKRAVKLNKNQGIKT